MKWLNYSPLLALALLLGACRGEEKPVDDADAVACVGSLTLTASEVRRNIPAGLDPDDSILQVRAFVRAWVEEQAVALEAERNIPDLAEIDRMVDDYRRQLVMWRYRHLVASQNEGAVEPTDAQIKAYYDGHQEGLKLTVPLVKGLFIRIPNNAQQLPAVHKLYRSKRPEDLDSIRRMVNSLATVEAFTDNWVDWTAIAARIPSRSISADPDNFPFHNDHLEFEADGYVYLLNITDRLEAGKTMPLDYARPIIVEALQRENTINIDKGLRRHLLEEATSRGDVRILIPME